MSCHHGDIAFPPNVAAVQLPGSRTRAVGSGGPAPPQPVAGTSRGAPRRIDRDYLTDQECFYIASVGETGWPDVQYLGGPSGFVRVLNSRALAWVDFAGNVQSVSVGNVLGDARSALIFVDVAHQQRLKIYGYARVVDIARDRQLLDFLAAPGFQAVVERAAGATITAFDRNRPDHIVPRFTVPEIRAMFARQGQQLG